MLFEFKLPDVGEGIHEAEVLAIKVREGDTVKEYQPIFDVETDKAVVEITSPVSGSVEKIFVKVGELARVGMVMISFQTAQEPSAKESAACGAGAFSSGEAGSPAKAESRPVEPAAAASSRSARVLAAPATRRLARELGLDLGMVKGSGPAGRVTRQDVMAHAGGTSSGDKAALPVAGADQTELSGESGALSAARLSEAPFEMPDFSKFGPVERVPLRSLRRRIALNMAQAWSHVPHVAHFDQIDITEMEAYRARHEEAVLKKGGRLTLTVLALKALAAALKKYPQFNVSLDERSNEIIYKRYYNIGVAVATERGLIVPVIRDVDRKSIVEIAIELADLALKTREGKIELERLQGGTFTVTNLGAIGGTGMMPMVNYPEAAIFGMARARLQPVVRDGQIVVRNILNVTLSFDHRVADGAEAALFVRQVSDCLEDPFKLLLEA